jgi:hypothetical protein
MMSMPISEWNSMPADYKMVRSGVPLVFRLNPVLRGVKQWAPVELLDVYPKPPPTSDPEAFGLITREDPEWFEAWEHLGRLYGSKACESLSGERWQYMGTETVNRIQTREIEPWAGSDLYRGTFHCFRHRDLNASRVHEWIPASPTWSLQQLNQGAFL